MDLASASRERVQCQRRKAARARRLGMELERARLHDTFVAGFLQGGPDAGGEAPRMAAVAASGGG